MLSFDDKQTNQKPNLVAMSALKVIIGLVCDTGDGDLLQLISLFFIGKYLLEIRPGIHHKVLQTIALRLFRVF